MSITTDTTDDTKNESTVRGTTTNKDYQPTSNTDMEEPKKAALFSSASHRFDLDATLNHNSSEEDETKISADDQKYFGCDENGKVPSEESQSDPSPMKVYELPSLPPALPGNEQEGYSGLGGAYALSNSMLARQYNQNAYDGIPFLQHQLDGGKFNMIKETEEVSEPPVKKAKANESKVVAKKKPFNPKTDTRVSQRPTERRENIGSGSRISVADANMVRTAFAAFEPWKETMKKNHPEVHSRNYRSLYQATLEIDPSAVSENTVMKVLTGNMTLSGPGSGTSPVYRTDMTDAFLTKVVKDAKEEGVTAKELFKHRGKNGSILRNKAEAFFGKKEYGCTFTSKKEKKQLTTYLGTHAKPYIEAALEEKAGKGEDL